MPHFAAATALAVAVAFGAVPASAQVPAATPSAAPGSLPEIGRVRSNTPACAALRDLVIPSFSAAQRADTRFLETRVRLPQYAELAVDKEHHNDVMRVSALDKLDADATAMQNEALALDKMLRDPRLKDSTDPQVIAERDGLQQLYAVQKARANQLQEFVIRERVATARAGLGGQDEVSGRALLLSLSLDAPPAPIPILNAPRGMPALTGKNALADKASLNEWSLTMAAAVRAGENNAAKAFLPIAKSCN